MFFSKLQVFNPYILHQLKSCNRVDIVWDVYKKDSLKTTARTKRGKGIRRRVLPNSKIPGNWHSFLRVDDNKEELFAFLADGIKLIETEKLVVSTRGESTVSNHENVDKSNMEPCKQEEADTRMFLHVYDGVINSGFKTSIIRNVDTDVVAIGMYFTEVWFLI